jgi:hypothetical protein
MSEQTIESLNKKIAVLEQRLSAYENDAVYRGYYALNKIVNQQVDVLNEFNLKSEISQNPKEDKKYDRVKNVWEGLKAMIIDLNALKTELRLTGNEERDNKKVPFIESVATKRD